LTEALVATAIISVVAAATFPAVNGLQRNAASSRNLSCARMALRSVTDQALTRGWNNASSPIGILAPTVSGTSSPYDATSGGWVEWDPYRSANADSTSLPVTIYSDQMNRDRNITGRLYRKVQYVTGSNRMLWVTFRMDYSYGGKNYSERMSTVRACDL
jgi:type II secretory pathway pseudopilin PulG